MARFSIDFFIFLCYYSYVLEYKTKNKRNQMKQIKTRKVLKYFDPIFKKNFSLKVEKVLSKNQEELKITLPTEKNFFRGVSFSENIILKKLTNGNWVKNLHAKFGEGAEEVFGLNEINEESDLESRDVRIIAFVEKSLV